MHKISGYFIFLSVVVTLYAYFFEPSYLGYSGLLLWISFFILFISLTKKKMIVILFCLSMIAFSISYINNYHIDFSKILSINQYLITLLIAVSFLRLVTISQSQTTKSISRGKESFLKTYLSVFLFSSVINISSLILIADELYKKKSLSTLQIILLSRSFSSNAYWSPFFVSFAAASTYAPNLNTFIIYFIGIILSIIVFTMTYFETIKDKSLKIDDFKGYPLSVDNLILPSLLAFVVLFTHYLYPHSKIIMLISLFALLFSFGFSLIKDGLITMIRKHATYISEELPKMKGEISLFLVAGMFGVSISSILLGLNIVLPLDNFDWMSASFLLLVFIVLGFVGIHPIISVAIISDYISQVNNTLFAVTFLMSWATTVSTSPFSGLNLTMVSKYQINPQKVFQVNIIYSIKIYFVSVFLLYLLSNYLNL
ncbi:MAG: tellurium resistance protein TerC [Arcobacteraceae bacterium]